MIDAENKRIITNTSDTNFKKYLLEDISSKKIIERIDNTIKKLSSLLEELQTYMEQNPQLLFDENSIKDLETSIQNELSTFTEIKNNQESVLTISIPFELDKELDKDYDNDGKTNREELLKGTNIYKAELEEDNLER